MSITGTIRKSVFATRVCHRIGDKNRYGKIKEFTCLALPPGFIHKPVGEWMCVNCAIQLLDWSMGRIKAIEVLRE